jgi:hypothetical protein
MSPQQQQQHTTPVPVSAYVAGQMIPALPLVRVPTNTGDIVLSPLGLTMSGGGGNRALDGYDGKVTDKDENQASLAGTDRSLDLVPEVEYGAAPERRLDAELSTVRKVLLGIAMATTYMVGVSFPPLLSYAA